MSNAFNTLKNCFYVSMAQPVDVGGLTSDDLVVDAVDLQGFPGQVNEIAFIIPLGNVAVDCDAFDVVTSASADLSTPTVVKALTEPTAAAGDNDSVVVIVGPDDLAKATQRYIGVRYDSGDGAALVSEFAVVRCSATPGSAAEAGKNFNASAKTVTVDWDGFD
jgi:hypothetical protein